MKGTGYEKLNSPNKLLNNLETFQYIFIGGSWLYFGQMKVEFP